MGVVCAVFLAELIYVWIWPSQEKKKGDDLAAAEVSATNDNSFKKVDGETTTKV